jgi:hypothetical protein
MTAQTLHISTDAAAAGIAVPFGFARGIANMATRTSVTELALAERCLR